MASMKRPDANGLPPSRRFGGRRRGDKPDRLVGTSLLPDSGPTPRTFLWYLRLKKPGFTPPGPVFGGAWGVGRIHSRLRRLPSPAAKALPLERRCRRPVGAEQPPDRRLERAFLRPERIGDERPGRRSDDRRGGRLRGRRHENGQGRRRDGLASGRMARVRHPAGRGGLAAQRLAGARVDQPTPASGSFTQKRVTSSSRRHVATPP